MLSEDISAIASVRARQHFQFASSPPMRSGKSIANWLKNNQIEPSDDIHANGSNRIEAGTVSRSAKANLPPSPLRLIMRSSCR